jgi:NDP-sugar pyrophosphorylase family protein
MIDRPGRPSHAPPTSARALAPATFAPGLARRGPGHDTGAVILAGSHYWGSGTFERLLRGPLLSVAQQPLLSYPLRWLRAGGVRTATVCAGRATDAVRAHFGAASVPELTLGYYVDAQPRGPAGCARDAALATDAQRFVLVEGALVPGLDLRTLVDEHCRSGAAATTVVEIDRRRPSVGGERHALPGGIYVFERRVLEAVPAAGFQDIKQGLLERLYTDGERVLVHEVAGVSPRILDFATYAAVSSWLITTALDRPDQYDGWYVMGDGCYHPTARVHPSARLFGPVLVGPGARVDADAVLVGPLSLGAGTVVEAGAAVTRSVLWDRCHVGREATVDAALLVDDSVIAPRAHVRGTVVADGAARDRAPRAHSFPPLSGLLDGPVLAPATALRGA